MMIPLGDVASVSTAFPFRRKVESEAGGDVAVIQMRDADVNSAEGNSESGGVILRNDDGRYDRYLLRQGDLLFQSRGLRNPSVVVGPGVRGIAASGLHVIRPDQARILPDYLSWWLNQPESQKKLAKDLARGTNVPFIAKTDLEAFGVPVPPLDLQASIAAIDHLQKREDALLARLRSLTARLTQHASKHAATRRSRRR
jgi:hypothetical protein